MKVTIKTLSTSKDKDYKIVKDSVEFDIENINQTITLIAKWIIGKIDEGIIPLDDWISFVIIEGATVDFVIDVTQVMESLIVK